MRSIYREKISAQVLMSMKLVALPSVATPLLYYNAAGMLTAALAGVGRDVSSVRSAARSKQ